MRRKQGAERGGIGPNRLASLLLALGLLSACANPLPNSADKANRDTKKTPALGEDSGSSRPRLDEETARTLNRLLPANTLKGQFVIQQRVTVRWTTPEGPDAATFEAALQRSGETLLLLGFGPLRQIGFELWLEDGRVRFENRTGRDVPFRPENILADVQRVFYPWLEANTACTECERQGQRMALEVEERIGKDLLEERQFRAIGRPDLGVVRLRYSGERLLGGIPSECEVTNEWFGYRLEISSHRIDRINEPEPTR